MKYWADNGGEGGGWKLNSQRCRADTLAVSLRVTNVQLLNNLRSHLASPVWRLRMEVYKFVGEGM